MKEIVKIIVSGATNYASSRKFKKTDKISGNMAIVNACVDFEAGANFILDLQEGITPEQTLQMLDHLIDAKNQIEYLHDKFKATGSGDALLSQINTFLSKLEQK